jgi:hypothetical protein
LSYFSVGFRTQAIEYKKVGDKQVCFITKCLLLEVSVVGIPANNESSFQIAKALPDGAGFYAGEFTDTKDSQLDAGSDNQNQTSGDIMKMKLKDVLGAEEIARLKEFGQDAKLEEEIEVDVKSYIESIFKAKFAALEVEITSLKEEVAALKAAPAVGTEEEGAGESEGTEEEEEGAGESEGTEEEISAEDKKSLEDMFAVIEAAKKELEIE